MEGKVVLVTGANRGIGFAIVQALAAKSPTSQYLLACRDKAKGAAAIEQLRSLGVDSHLDVVELDIASDDSTRAAEREVRAKYGRLDRKDTLKPVISDNLVLINNAGIALMVKDGLSDVREAYGTTFDVNVSSVAVTMSTFLPLLREAPDGRVINVSSARGSLTRASSPAFPPTASIPYNVSKAALNMLTLEYAKAGENEGITFHSINPGFCKTEFNSYRGTKDPVVGAKVVVELATAPAGKFRSGFYQMEGDEAEPTTVPW